MGGWVDGLIDLVGLIPPSLPPSHPIPPPHSHTHTYIHPPTLHTQTHTPTRFRCPTNSCTGARSIRAFNSNTPAGLRPVKTGALGFRPEEEAAAAGVLVEEEGPPPPPPPLLLLREGAVIRSLACLLAG